MPNFDPRTARLVTYYCNCDGDIKRAAREANVKLAVARRIYKNLEVRAECDKRLDILHTEQAKLAAQAQRLQVNFLDHNLVVAVREGARKGDTKALELGYARVGLMRNNQFTAPPASADPNAPPKIYRAEHTVTRTEQVTESIEALQY
jgi:hypothetical protein